MAVTEKNSKKAITNFKVIDIAAKALYTVNLPGIFIFIVSDNYLIYHILLPILY